MANLVGEALSSLPNNASTNEPLQGAQCSLIVTRDEADGVTYGMSATCAANTVHIIFRMHWKVVIHHMRDPVDVDASGSDIGRYQDPQRTGLKILQCLQALALRAV